MRQTTQQPTARSPFFPTLDNRLHHQTINQDARCIHRQYDSPPKRGRKVCLSPLIRLSNRTTSNRTGQTRRAVRSYYRVRVQCGSFPRHVIDDRSRNVGYILHSSIDLPSTARVADVGTGTARFLLRLQPTYPDAVLEGFDISSALYPPPGTLPPNVFLSVRDMKQPFPAGMHGK